MTSKPAANSWSSFVLGFLFCVLMPAFVTAIAPVSHIRFEKREQGVAASTKQCLLFVIPYYSRTIFPVLEVGDHVRASRQYTAEERRKNHGRNGTVEGEASLIVMGEGEDRVSVPVSPVNIKSVKERAEAFVKAPTDAPLNMFVVANWKFSVIAGGCVSLLTVLYVVGVFLSIMQGMARFFLPPNDDRFAEEERTDLLSQ